MALVLGIDAGWTETGSSGVVLLETGDDAPRLLACAPSYASFISLSEGTPVSWSRVQGSPLDVEALLKAATRLGGADIDVIAIDMTVAWTEFVGRRAADQEISFAFGAAWAGTHSPTPAWPGAYGRRVAKQFVSAGFQIATKDSHPASRLLVEVYPLAALVRLMNVPVRPPYKVSRTNRYWPGTTTTDRIGKLLQVWSQITAMLRNL